MLKNIVVILLFFSLLACKPASQPTQVNNKPIPVSFVCLTSQSQCEVETHYGVFSIQFSAEQQQDKIKTELPFSIQLTFNSANSKFQLKNIASFLEGKTMFMGKIPVFFEIRSIDQNVDISKVDNSKIDNSQIDTNNTFIAESLLASCSEEIMTWKLWFNVEILADGVSQQQDFFIEFDSERL